MKIPNALKQFNEFVAEVAKLDTDNLLELIPHATVRGVYCVMVEGTNRGVQLWLDKQDLVIDYVGTCGHHKLPVTYDVKGFASRVVLFLQCRRQLI